MLSVRNAVLAASILLVVAVASSVVSMMQTPDSDGLGHDSFGTRGGGYRGLYETLDELGIATSRDFAPPDVTAFDGTLVLLGPDPQIVGFEPSYLHKLLPWVERGGRIVVAPRERDRMFAAMHDELDEPPPTVLETLGLGGLQLTNIGSDPEPRRRRRSGRVLTPEEMSQEILDQMTAPVPMLIDVSVEVDDPQLSDVRRLTIPADSLTTLILDETTPADGTVVWTDADEVPHTLVARFARGRGEIVVVADPQLFANRLIAGADNSVLAVQSLSPTGRAVQFDEFYHGLGVRGSPLYLLTRLSYATVALGLLVLLGVWTWRTAVFLGPPLPDVETTRRDISEYLTAMGRFFAVGGSGRGRLVQQVRDGVLRQISEEAGLPPDAGDVDRIAAAVARRDVRRGEMIVEATRAVDNELRSRRHWSEPQTLDAMQRMTDCLSKNAIRPSVPNSRKSSLVRTR